MKINQTGNYLRLYRAKIGISQSKLAEILNLNQSTIAQIETFKANPTLEFLQKIQELTGASLDEIVYGDNTIINSNSIPIINTPAAAGFFITMESGESGANLEDRILIPGINTRNVHVAIRVVGGSMYPTIHEGDLIVCRKLESLDDFVGGKIYVVVLEDGTVSVKRVYMDTETALLRSDNISILDKNIARTEIRQLWEVISRLTHNLQPEDIQKKFPI